jgi:hypothetical protein
MPYKVCFSKMFVIGGRDKYSNECCIGGDLVVDQLRSEIRKRFGDAQEGQEDWGWFIWFKNGPTKFAVDIFCDEPNRGEFRIHLTSRRAKWLFLDSVEDTEELDELKCLVVDLIESWTEESCRVIRLDQDYDLI